MSPVGIVFDGECGRRFFTRACKSFEDVDTEHSLVGGQTMMFTEYILCKINIMSWHASCVFSWLTFCTRTSGIIILWAYPLTAFHHQTAETFSELITRTKGGLMATTTDLDILDPSNSSKNTLKLENVSYHV